jgi:DNA-binding SARP family transcriptional activator
MLDISGSRLPPFHISRPRLSGECTSERVVVVEAAGGYGKSVLAAELVEVWGALPIWVVLEEGEVSAQLLAGRLRGAVAAAGLSDAAGAMAAAGDDPPGAVDAMLAALRGESVAIAIDDAHNAARDAAGLIERIADQLVQPQRLVVLARRLPDGVPHLRRAGVHTLTAADLALRPEETLELCRAGFGLEVSAAEGRQLDAATGGWTAAVALAASMAKRTSQRLGAVAKLSASHADALTAILDEVVAMLSIDRRRAAQLGFLPLLDAELLALLGGEGAFLERALAAGLPLTRTPGGWWQLPGPVRDQLAAGTQADAQLLATAARHYARRGELGTALQMLLAAVDLSTSGTTPTEAEMIARRVVDAAAASEELTRARALSVIGKTIWWQPDEQGRRSVSRMREAADYFDQSAEILLGLGLRAAVASLAIYRGMWIDFELGRAESALSTLTEALGLSVEVPRRFTAVLFYRARVLTELGRHDESEADLEEVLRIARQLGDPGSRVAYVHWERFRRASMRGDTEATLHHVQQTEANRADWWEHGRYDFLADAADCLCRVGQTALAWEYLARAQADPGDAGHLIAMAEGALLACSGDPLLAEERLTVVDRQGVTPRELWRATLLRAYAAFRRGDPAAGGLAARAFDEAARLGQPQAPLIREHGLTESLLALAVDTGLPAALAMEHASLPVAVSVLGRFELTSGGRAIALPPSQAEQLIKLIAVSGGRIQAEQAIEALWPEAGRDAGRNRLRTVLSRLRDSAGDIVRREGDLLALDAGVRLDVTEFHRAAREAKALAAADPAAAVAVARSAIARYRGPLLPHDPYADWAEEPRETTRSTMLDLLDLCASVALDRGDLDEARRMVQRTIELAPYDDDRWLAVASILRDQGRRGAALSVLRRARAALAQLGLDPPRKLAELEREVADEAAGRAPLAV